MKILKKTIFLLGLVCIHNIVSMEKLIQQQNYSNHTIHSNVEKKDILAEMVEKKQIKIKNNSYIFNIDKKTQNQIFSIKYKEKFEQAVQKILNKKDVDKKVVGFNVCVFDDEVYITPFLGRNAK